MIFFNTFFIIIYSQAFEDHVKTVINTLRSKLDDVTDPFIQRGEILMAKHELYEVCFAEVINVASSSSPKFGAVLRKLQSIHKDLFAEFPATLHEMRPHYLQRLTDMKNQVVRAERESSLLLQAAETLEEEAMQHQQERERSLMLSGQQQNGGGSAIATRNNSMMPSSANSYSNRSITKTRKKKNGGYASPSVNSASSKRPVSLNF